MQREIKFRAWEKKQKAFINGFNMIGFSTGQGAPSKKLQRFSDYWDSDNIELMQYTGLHDKNGKEIYEGDIVKPKYKDTIGTVTWRNDRFIIKWGKGIDYLRDDLDYWSLISHIEIIGNIYEDPELLTQPTTGTE